MCSENPDFPSIFRRTKTILYQLKNSDLINWINNEINGYSEFSGLPSYRKIRGIMYGNFIQKGRIEYTNRIYPLDYMLKNVKNPDNVAADDILIHGIYESFNSMDKNVLDGSVKKLQRDFDSSVCSMLSNHEIQAMSLYVKIPSSSYVDCYNKIINILHDILLKLEDEFGNLDELDIADKFYQLSSERKDNIILSIKNLVFGDSIEIGDNNKFSKSSLLSNWEELNAE